jgi:bacterioferritin
MDDKDMIKMCGGVDYVTQDMAITLLAGEEDHRREILGFLTEYEQAQVFLTQC